MQFNCNTNHVEQQESLQDVVVQEAQVWCCYYEGVGRSSILDVAKSNSVAIREMCIQLPGKHLLSN